MRRRVFIAAVVLLAAMVAVGPAATAQNVSGSLSVASKHTTDSDFNSASTLTNVTVANDQVALGQGAPFADGFEDGDISEWSGDTGEFSVVNSPVADGSNALAWTGPQRGVITQSFTNDSYTDLTVAIRVDDVTDTADQPVISFEDTGARSVSIRVDDGTLKGDAGSLLSYNTSTSTYTDTGFNLQNDTWYEIEATNIDYSAQTFDITVKDLGGNTLDTTTGVTFYEDANGIDEVQVDYVKTAYADSIAVGSTEFGSGEKASGQYVSANHSAEQVGEMFYNLTLANASADLVAEYYDGSSWVQANSTTVTTSKNHTLVVSASASKWRANVTFRNKSGTTAAELHDEGVLFDASATSGSNPDPGGGSKITSYDGDVSLDVSDPDFGLAQGDEVTVTLTNSSGAQLNQTTVTSNGTVSFAYTAMAGTNELNWTLTDSYGQTTTVSQDFATPANLTAYNVSAPKSKITDVSVEVGYYEDGEDQVIIRNTSDATINMAGVPADTTLVVRAEAEGYYTRTTLIESIYEQQSLFLLPKNGTDVSTNEFEIVDRTRVFGADAELQISRALNTTDSAQGELLYKSVAGDRIGSQDTVSTTLEQDVRYRIEVSNDAQTRTLGTFTPVTSGRTVTLTIGRVEFQAVGEDGYTFSPSFKTGEDPNNTDDNSPGDGDRIVVKWFDSENATSDATIAIYERGNESNKLVPNQTITGPVPSLKNVYALSPNESDTQWMVTFTATRNGESITLTRPVGGTDIPLPVDSKWLGSMALVAITFIQLLFGGRLAAWGGVVTCVFAGVLMMFQWVPINPIFYSVAFLVAIGGHVRANGGIGP